LDHQEKVLSMLEVNDEEPAGVEEVVTAAKLITEVVTIAGVDVNAATRAVTSVWMMQSRPLVALSCEQRILYRALCRLAVYQRPYHEGLWCRLTCTRWRLGYELVLRWDGVGEEEEKEAHGLLIRKKKKIDVGGSSTPSVGGNLCPDYSGISHLEGIWKNYTLYLMRRSLEILRKFHWMILGGRFNQCTLRGLVIVTRTKSFARLVEEEATKNNGVYLTRGKLYQISRTRKDGSIVIDKAAQIVASLQVIANDSTNTQGIQEDDWTNDDLSKVKGPEKRGYVQCVRKILSLRNNGASSSISSQTVEQRLAQI
nr:hypothetical protein [Tanacetum cinerariifolium]